MTRAQSAAREVSDYLLTGMHHATAEGQVALAAIIARHSHAQAAEQARFWEDCMRDALRDKEQAIAGLLAR